jgi:hypothetical protein
VDSKGYEAVLMFFSKQANQSTIYMKLPLLYVLLKLSFQAVSKDVSEVELERAKSAAVSSVLMNLESRAVVAEDIGRQVLTYGHRWAGGIEYIAIVLKTHACVLTVCCSCWGMQLRLPKLYLFASQPWQ